jgi:hypothetical protein
VIHAQTRIEIKASDLDKGITEQLSKDYSEYTISKAFKVDANKIITYEVHLQKGNENMIVTFDKDGVFIKKEVPKAKTTKPLLK